MSLPMDETFLSQDKEFDFVHSSAVLEHVGSREKQTIFLSEAWRVARKGIFITTPNRWFPVEFHTVMLLAHWLPPNAFRSICRLRGLDFFASEDNLNLLSARGLRRIASASGTGKHQSMECWTCRLARQSSSFSAADTVTYAISISAISTRYLDTPRIMLIRKMAFTTPGYLSLAALRFQMPFRSLLRSSETNRKSLISSRDTQRASSASLFAPRFPLSTLQR